MAVTSISLSSHVESGRNWLELPKDLTTSILARVGSIDVLLSVRKVCKLWRKICFDQAMWQVVNIGHSFNFYNLFREIKFDENSKKEVVAKKAIDLSCGQMIDFTIESAGSNDLLRYISDRSCQLRRLKLISCKDITSEGLSEMVTKLPLLEELHLHNIPVSNKTIEVIGRCCPQLKSFSFNYFYLPYDEFDEEALAIAENMPGLHYLQLLGNSMTSLGLLAILDNCLHLESLDMRRCLHVADLERDLERRIFSKQSIRLPFDSMRDYEFNFFCELEDHDEVGAESFDYYTFYDFKKDSSEDYPSEEYEFGGGFNIHDEI